MWCHLLPCPRRAASLVALIAVVVQAGIVGAQDTTGRPTLDRSGKGDTNFRDSSSPTTPLGGPTFFAVRTQDGARVDARQAPELNRRVSISLVDAPLGAAVQSVAARAGLEVTYSTELLPASAHVTVSADNVTVATALSRVLATARLDVLVSPEGHLTLVAQARGASQNDSSAVLSGRLVDAEDGQPVPYATVLLLGTSWASFADADGRFRLSGLAPGSYSMRARQIGYSPVDTVAVIDPALAGSTLALAMHRIPAFLPLVTVKGEKGCATGVPDSAVNPGLSLVFAQVRENVDRVRLLLDTYPFRYSREEEMVLRLNPGGDVTQWIDTVAYESGDERPYQVGGIVQADSGGQRPGHYMYLPTFSAFGDSAFLSAHCFVYGGTESLGGRDESKVVRIDFHPSPLIRVPDVEGSIYLDAQRLVVRRAVFRMTRPEAARPRVLGVTVSTTFREFVPFVPIFDAVESITPLPPGPPPEGYSSVVGGQGPLTFRGPGSIVGRSLVERHHVLEVAFERGSPGVQRAPAQAALAGARGRAGRPRPARPARITDTVQSHARLAGRVVQPDGAPVSGAAVEVVGTHDTAMTDPTGHFTIRGGEPGPYVVSVRRLGFEPSRVAVTLTSQSEREVSVTLLRTIPVLPTVTTTAAERAAYRDVGFDQRMQAGIGQFLTDAQIEHLQATKLSELLIGMRGIIVRYPPKNFGATIEGTRGLGSCIGYIIDGVPQVQLASQTSGGTKLPPDDADNVVDPSTIGAIEVYTPSERPAQFGPGLFEHPQPLDTPGTQQSSRAPTPLTQQCSLVVIWTRGRLGLTGTHTQIDTKRSGEVTRGRPAFGPDAACLPHAATDTADFSIYATLEGEAPPTVPRRAWSAYADSVLAAIERWSVLPTELLLPTFGPPIVTDGHADAGSPEMSGSRRVAPTLSTVLVFTLDSAGALTDARVAASSQSGAADTSMLAMLARAAAAHAFPPLPTSPPRTATVRFNLFVSSVEPPPDTRAAVLGRLEVPIWPLARQASLTSDGSSGTGPGGADVVTVAMAVGPEGRAIGGTAWALATSLAPQSSADDARFGARIAQGVRDLRFEPARIGACPIAQLVTQAVPVPAYDTPDR